MGINLWAYTREKCAGDVCPGDCDLCEKADGRFPQKCIKCENFRLEYQKDPTGSWECAVRPHCGFKPKKKQREDELKEIYDEAH